ncbi:MAG: hypothetical protein VCF24_02385 [Candidatus Latescibacterota bacterium]
MKSLLEGHVGETIGINIDRPHHIDAAEVLAAHDAYFSVQSSFRPTCASHPVRQPGQDRRGRCVEIRHLFTANERFNVVIKVGHVVTYMPT